MARIVLRITLTILIFLGFYLLFKILYIYPKFDGKNPLNVDMIESQFFSISAESDTVIIGLKGSILVINENSFRDCNGNRISGKIDIELKEIMSGNDLVLSGLTTTSDGALLETAGMIYINAQQNKVQLCLNDENKIGILIPAKEINSQMKTFEGNFINDIINWTNPLSLLNNPDSVHFGEIPESLLDLYGLKRASFISDSLGNTGKNIPEYLDSLIRKYESIYIENQFLDEEISYVFEANKIGWINIDRFIELDEMQEVDFSISINNIDDFQNPFIRLVFIDLNTSITPFRIYENEFVFGKSQNSLVQLPILKKAIIIATSYKNGESYFDLKEITIEEKQQIEMTLKKTSQEKFKNAIQEIF